MLIDHSFGRRAKQARIESGMSQREVVAAAAALPGVVHALSLSTLKRIEASETHSNKWIIQLKRIFASLR